ncbi:MAG: sugar ABC transporter substrate-binding protein [Sphaerochaetaceae bacterium]|nr:sugar ABC transporter substrate-binding protein [Sphaerochaetaceae bacterium]MDC7246766.1 sugar ABC transporter substrate-binding protein [Sphaerochaetaceae bacterium]
MRKGIVVLFILCLLVPSAIFAAGAQESDQVTIAFCFQDLETEFWVAGHKAITETLRENGIKVIEKNANEDANRQLEQVKDVITQGVDGVIIIPQDGESAVTIAKTCNEAGVPIGVFNRPPSDKSAKNLVVVANNEVIAEAAVEHMAQEAMKLGRKVHPAIMVGDLGDPNAVGRRQGFMNVIEKYPDLWAYEPVEIPTKWDANVALANLQSAMQANPDIDFLFTSSDFLFPVIKSVLAPLGKWTTIDDPNHVILAGLDGDVTAAQLLEEGYIDATGVQNLFYEADLMIDAMLEAINAGNGTPDKWMDDPGFALTQANLDTRAEEMWGWVLYKERQ